MNILSIRVRDNKTSYLPGETLEGNISWQLQGGVEALELRLIWFTSGKGDTDVSVENTQRFNSPLLSGDSLFRFDLPAAPHSFSGRFISLSWALELVVISGEASTRWEFCMAPEGQEIKLIEVKNPDQANVPSWLKKKFKSSQFDGFR